MPSTASATVVQGNLSGSILNWIDTGSYGTIDSRTLDIYDYQGTLLLNVSLGVTLTYAYTITADAWFSFIATIVDNTGTFTSTVYFTATGFYIAAYLNLFTSTNCGCQGNNCNMESAEYAYNAAVRFNLAGLAGAAQAQREIVAANVLINTNVIPQY